VPTEANPFFEQCALPLGVKHEGEPFAYSRRTRWNNRVAGPGRYPGRGVIRRFSANNILVLLRDPKIHKTFKSEAEVISFLESLDLC
jgi:hypothetical protein